MRSLVTAFFFFFNNVLPRGRVLGAAVPIKKIHVKRKIWRRKGDKKERGNPNNVENKVERKIKHYFTLPLPLCFHIDSIFPSGTYIPSKYH